MRARFTAMTIAFSVLSANVAWADDDADKRQQRSKALWDEGSRRYDLGKFDEAIDLFLKAYEIWPFEPILFNLCQAHRQKSEYKKATFYCKAYLRNLPHARNRQDVEDLVIDMDKTLEQQKATNERPPEGVEHPIPLRRVDRQPIAEDAGGEARPYDTWKWLALIAGGLAVGTGATLIVIDEDGYSSTGNRRTDFPDTATAGVITTVMGTVLVGTGAMLWIFDRQGRAHHDHGAAGVAPTDGGLVVLVGGEF